MTKDDVLDIISDAGYCLFATVEGKQPRVRPLAPYYNSENNTLLVSLVPGSRAIKQIQENPLVELCFVDRKMSFCRISSLRERVRISLRKAMNFSARVFSPAITRARSRA